MSRAVVTCNEDDVVVDIARMMEAANVGSIPVVQSANLKRLVGILTDRDIVLRVVANERNPNLTKANAVMTPIVVTCHPDDDIETAMDKMGNHQIRRIPVVDNDNMVVGIIAQADIARHMDRQSTGSVVGEISEETKVEIE
jgi:CBS domain-containing protein